MHRERTSGERSTLLRVVSLVVLVWAGGFLSWAMAAGVGPVNGDASVEARRVLAYLRSIQGERTLSGHHVVYGDMARRELGYVEQTAGGSPAVLEFEAGIFTERFSAEWERAERSIVEDAVAHWNMGGLVAMCWHWGNPMEARNTYEGTKRAFDIEAALREGTPEHEAMVKDLDVTARLLGACRDRGVPVLWRPLHEMCGGWFWWSKHGKENAQRLWRFMYEYFTGHHGLNNLLWVYSASQEMRMDWMPGLDVVDVVGVDIYREGQQGVRANYERVASVAGGKPVVLSECDLIPSVESTRGAGFQWGWVTTWHSNWVRKNSPEALRAFYGSEFVVVRDELPRLGFEGGLGVFEGSVDVGVVGHRGGVVYDSASGVYSVTGGGENMWFDTDAFHFLWRRVSGDVVLSAEVEFEGEGGNAHRKACLMVRQDLGAGSAYADAALHGDGLTSLQYRALEGERTYEIQANVSGPRRVRIEKRGRYVSMSVWGEEGGWVPAGGSFRLDLEEPFYVGLGVCAHDDAVVETVRFSRVELGEPEPLGDRPRLLSVLETVPIDSKDRRAVYVTTNHIEAPNWSPDGGRLLYNSGGRLYWVPVGGGGPVMVDTGFADRCNNDHGISPDGKRLVISDQSQGGRQSLIYTLPIEGGRPDLVTPRGPSYWHGWSPDGATLVYCAERGGEYDVYAIPVGGGEEVRLTEAEGLDDGPEYSPDGEWIYFNSVRTGTMEIWRMRADGSGEERVTDDEYNNWFAHPSPDGKWLVFLSYEPGVEGHPANQDVTLRLMPVGGGEIQVLARLFGGQGTINVPSWSPDSRRVAFVSYQQVP